MAKKQTFRDRLKQWTVPSLLLNKYVFTVFVFGVWMTFFDQNNFIRQYGRIDELAKARSKTKYYVTETAKANEQLSELKSDMNALEKFAREEYYMKKPNEDVFVIIDK
jgi:cell division protein DivIC